MDTPKANIAATMAIAEQTADPLYVECQRLERQTRLLVDQLAECAGYIASVRHDRRLKDQHGNVFVGQTVEWADGAKEIAAKANALLTAYDEGTLGNEE